MFQSVEAVGSHDDGSQDGSVHQPDRPLTGRDVLPENIRLAIPIEIGCFRDFPSCRDNADIYACPERGAIH